MGSLGVRVGSVRGRLHATSQRVRFQGAERTAREVAARMLKRLVGPALILAYAAVSVATFVVVRQSASSLDTVLLDVLFATLPILLASVTWRLVWPRWKLLAKPLLHPCIYALLSVWMGHWSILVAWLHQGVLGLGGHIWFSRKHGFRWYSAEDPDRYVALSKQAAAPRWSESIAVSHPGGNARGLLRALRAP